MDTQMDERSLSRDKGSPGQPGKDLRGAPATQGTAPFVERPGSWIDTGNNIEAKN